VGVGGLDGEIAFVPVDFDVRLDAPLARARFHLLFPAPSHGREEGWASDRCSPHAELSPSAQQCHVNRVALGRPGPNPEYDFGT
jgi:hypothetical protein